MQGGIGIKSHGGIGSNGVLGTESRHRPISPASPGPRNSFRIRPPEFIPHKAPGIYSGNNSRINTIIPRPQIDDLSYPSARASVSGGGSCLRNYHEPRFKSPKNINNPPVSTEGRDGIAARKYLRNPKHSLHHFKSTILEKAERVSRYGGKRYIERRETRRICA